MSLSSAQQSYDSRSEMCTISLPSPFISQQHLQTLTSLSRPHVMRLRMVQRLARPLSQTVTSPGFRPMLDFGFESHSGLELSGPSICRFLELAITGFPLGNPGFLPSFSRKWFQAVYKPNRTRFHSCRVHSPAVPSHHEIELTSSV